ncbi:MAG: aldolase [Rickettsiales bacterium]|jgi:2-keto-3-deoxy-L-rhamnonate aldolase RhmA|nr:aldolase [Rhodospirillaceae bacterium]MBO88648.1 aldolase [Rickettsiales bacterium]|tara:strand:- start:1253 stop:2035 length:783 start_codon:yes stop_codon:yes gene_type:complete
MVEIINAAKQKLEAGELAIGVGLRMTRVVEIGKMMKTAGYDWLFIDMEHNSMSIDDAAQISVAAQSAGITPIVRVPGFQHFHASRALDTGAQGIVIPHVDDIQTAKKMVENVKYPPVGKRSITGSLPQLDFVPTPVDEATKAINDATLLIVMLETEEAVENAEAMAALDGIDALLFGTSDLTIEMGIPGQMGHPRVVKHYETAAAACKKHGKFLGMGGIYDPAVMKDYVAMGAQLILAGNDFPFLMKAAKEQAEIVRGMG